MGNVPLTVEKYEWGYRAIVPGEYSIVGLWLDGDVGEDDSDFILELWREIAEQTRGERGKIMKTVNDTTIVVDHEVVFYYWGAALYLSLGELASVTERWFRFVSPAVAEQLAAIRATWRSGELTVGPMTPAAASIVDKIHAVLSIHRLSVEAAQRVLGVVLAEVPATGGWRTYEASPTSGPLATVTLSLRDGRGSVSFTPRENLFGELLDLDRFGPRPMPDTLADAALLSYVYPRDGKKLTITLAAYTHVLTAVSVAWVP